MYAIKRHLCLADAYNSEVCPGCRQHTGDKKSQERPDINCTQKKTLHVNENYLTLRASCYIIAKVIDMDEVLKQSLLYDFYGELLTEHQRNVYEEVVQNDLSYSEAAEMFGVSRQGIHELIKRCNKILAGYEEKLHLVERFLRIRSSVQEIQVLSAQYDSIEKEALAKQVLSISDKILEEL